MTTIVTDPYDAAVAGLPPLKLKADVVTISNDAPGHNAFKTVKGVRHILTGPGEYEIGGVFITAIRTNGKGQAKTPRNTVFLFDYGGVTIAHLGNMRRVPTQAEIEALGTVHVALVPVGGGGGLTAAQAAEVISVLEPSIVVPMHYRLPGTALELDGVARFLKQMGVEGASPAPVLKVTPSSIPQELQVVVLENANAPS
jgi:L-ascorbate metabolism protein UlaG (beta-lactamase superfamily)